MTNRNDAKVNIFVRVEAINPAESKGDDTVLPAAPLGAWETRAEVSTFVYLPALANALFKNARGAADRVPISAMHRPWESGLSRHRTPRLSSVRSTGVPRGSHPGAPPRACSGPWPERDSPRARPEWSPRRRSLRSGAWLAASERRRFLPRARRRGEARPPSEQAWRAETTGPARTRRRDGGFCSAMSALHLSAAVGPGRLSGKSAFRAKRTWRAPPPGSPLSAPGEPAGFLGGSARRARERPLSWVPGSGAPSGGARTAGKGMGAR